eukprot:5601741-Amphidinium_carterae.1
MSCTAAGQDAASERAVEPSRIDALPASSVDCAILTRFLPDFNVSSETLVGTLRAASHVLRHQGQLVLFSGMLPAGSPVWSVLNSPQLGFHVVVVDTTDAAWMYVCTKVGDSKGVEALPRVPNSVRLMLEAGNPALKQAQLTVWTRNPAEAIFVHSEIFKNRCYEEVSRLMSSVGSSSKKELVIVDAGMNIGLFALFAARLAGRTLSRRPLHVVCFEPAPEAYALALCSLQEAGLQVVDHGTKLPKRVDSYAKTAPLVVHAFNMALSGTSSTAETREILRFYPNSSINSAFVRHKPEMLWLE